MMTPAGEERAAAADSSASALRACFGQALACRLEQHTGRLSWDAQRLARHQRDQLRALLAAAVSRSPFHARRLAGICPARFELSQLVELPVMTKEQMMASFDELVTDRRLTRARAEEQLVASADGPGLLYGQYVCLASGGSSGLRGPFVQTVGEYAEFAASVLRRAMARASAAGGPPPGGLPVAIVAAASPVHSSGFAAAVARGYPVRMIPAPATLPAGEIVRRLNDAQPPALLAHTSALMLLAGEQRAGRWCGRCGRERVGDDLAAPCASRSGCGARVPGRGCPAVAGSGAAGTQEDQHAARGAGRAAGQGMPGTVPAGAAGPADSDRQRVALGLAVQFGDPVSGDLRVDVGVHRGLPGGRSGPGYPGPHQAGSPGRPGAGQRPDYPFSTAARRRGRTTHAGPDRVGGPAARARPARRPAPAGSGRRGGGSRSCPGSGPGGSGRCGC